MQICITGIIVCYFDSIYVALLVLYIRVKVIDMVSDAKPASLCLLFLLLLEQMEMETVYTFPNRKGPVIGQRNSP